jgi:hypothetical protein
MAPSKHDVAKAMVELLKETGYLSQRLAATGILEKFGDEFLYKNENDRWAILPEVLDEFQTLTEKDVVWEHRLKRWRMRTPEDHPGRGQGMPKKKVRAGTDS